MVQSQKALFPGDALEAINSAGVWAPGNLQPRLDEVDRVGKLSSEKGTEYSCSRLPQRTGQEPRRLGPRENWYHPGA